MAGRCFDTRNVGEFLFSYFDVFSLVQLLLLLHRLSIALWAIMKEISNILASEINANDSNVSNIREAIGREWNEHTIVD